MLRGGYHRRYANHSGRNPAPRPAPNPPANAVAEAAPGNGGSWTRIFVIVFGLIFPLIGIVNQIVLARFYEGPNERWLKAVCYILTAGTLLLYIPWLIGLRSFYTTHDLQLSIIVSDLVQGISATLNIKWVHNGKAVCSSVCTAQGSLKIVAETSSAMATLAITVATVLLIGFKVPFQSKILALILIVAAWTFVLVYVGVLLGRDRRQLLVNEDGKLGRLMVPAPYWCWLSGFFQAHRIPAEYVWLWAAAFSSIVLYIPLFFYLLRLDNTERHPHYAFLAYPTAYTVLVLPLSVIRWVSFTKPNVRVAPWATLMTNILFNSMGWVNVTLFLWLKQSSKLINGEVKNGLSTNGIGSFSSLDANNNGQDVQLREIGGLPDNIDDPGSQRPRSVEYYYGKGNNTTNHEQRV